MDRICKDNVTIAGTLTAINDTSDNLRVTGVVSVTRASGVSDNIPFVANKFACRKMSVGDPIFIGGKYASRNTDTGNVELYIECDDISKSELSNIDCNYIELSGYVCKKPVYRSSHFGKKITDITLAVNICGKHYYIPLIAWDVNALKLGILNVSDFISIIGRIQSRTYQKLTKDNQLITKVAYEVSVCKVKIDK